MVLRPTEMDGIFSFAIAGHQDNVKIFANDEELKQALRDCTQRDDITYGSVTWKTDYRFAELIHTIRSDTHQSSVGLVFVW